MKILKVVFKIFMVERVKRLYYFRLGERAYETQSFLYEVEESFFRR